MSGKVIIGLEGVLIANSTICYIEGQNGILRYRGIDINDLARFSSYEETAYLLWFGELPTHPHLEEFKARLAAEREIDESMWNILTSLPRRLPPIDALRTVVSALAACDPSSGDNSREANLNRAIYLTAKMPTIVAYHHCYSEGKERVRPNPALSHAANFLYMLRGEPPTVPEERAMDMAMLLMADHELNASTFAARVTASTLSDMYSAVTSAIGTLKGPLHGGANEGAMEMLLEIGEVENVEPYIAKTLAAGKRVMGFGHRVYRTIDPRAIPLQGMVCTLRREAEHPDWCNLALKVARTVAENKNGLYPNLDLFAAPLLYTLGIPLSLLTPVFALSRVIGWTAHVMEQYEGNRLIRPLSNYVGPGPRPYVPIEAR